MLSIASAAAAFQGAALPLRAVRTTSSQLAMRSSLDSAAPSSLRRSFLLAAGRSFSRCYVCVYICASTSCGCGCGPSMWWRMDECVQICAGVSVAGQMIATPQHVLAFENRVAAKVSFSVSLALPCAFSFSLFVSLSFSLSPSLSFSLCSINLYM